MMSRLLTVAVSMALACSAAAAAPSLVPLPQGQTPDQAAAMAQYQAMSLASDLTSHTVGRMSLAVTGHPDTADRLASDYRNDQRLGEYTRYTIATVLGELLQDQIDAGSLVAECVPRIAAEDLWLQTKAFSMLVRQKREDEVLAAARRAATHQDQAAAILALGLAGSESADAAIAVACDAQIGSDPGSRMLVRAIASAYQAARLRLRPDQLAVCTPKIDQLAKSPNPFATSVLGYLLAQPVLPLDPKMASHIIAPDLRQPDSATNAYGTQKRDPEVALKPAEKGNRICYVVDLSGSMMAPVALQAPPQSAGNSGTSPRINWDRIRTRWDLVREHLRASLSALSPSQHYALVWFGTECGTFESTPVLIPATPENITATIAELDAIVDMRGGTNLHAGVKLGFALTDTGSVTKGAYVDEIAIEKGCDTMVLLSDGTPTVDDHGGIFSMWPWIIDDIVRMNLLRRVQIHCVGLGDADMDPLEQISAVTAGVSTCIKQNFLDVGGPLLPPNEPLPPWAILVMGALGIPMAASVIALFYRRSAKTN